MAEISIRDLGPDDGSAAADLLALLNPDTPPAIIRERLETILTDHAHYQLVAAFSENCLVGLAGAWVATKIWCGRYLEIDNLVVRPDFRSNGIGSLLIRHFEGVARELGCEMVVLDSYTANHPSHRFYHRLGFEIWGFHFVKSDRNRPTS